MKNLLIIVASLSFVFASFGQTSSVQDYPLQFSYRCSSGTMRDTTLSVGGLRLPSTPSNGPTYLKWKDEPLCIVATDAGMRLFADSSSSFVAGQTIGWAFFKTRSLGHFEMDYSKSNLWQFIEDSASPNMQVVLTTQGIQLKAATSIAPGAKLTVRYNDIKALFPGDPTVQLHSRRL